MEMTTKRFLLQLLSIFAVFCGVKSECYAAASYQTTTEKYVCRLHQSNWASEAMFEVKFLHCLEEPTVNVFIRNFYGVDEINMNFDRLTSNWKTINFSGKTSMIRFRFSTFKASSKYSTHKQIQVQVLYYAKFPLPENEHLMTAIFPAHDKSDCSWASTLAMHDQIFFGGGVCLVLVFILIVAYCVRRNKKKPMSGTFRPVLNDKRDIDRVQL